MASFTIPTLQDSLSYTLQCELSGSTYLLSFDWNAADLSWYMTIADATEQILLAGKKLITGWPFLFRYVQPGLPPGEFLMQDTSGKNEKPTVDNLGTRVLLYYLTADA